jgi:hypothetical protein
MEYRRIRLAEVLHEGPEANRYRFTWRGGIESLAKSLQRDGLLTPPVLAERPGAGLQVVCGSRRIRALTMLGESEADALVLGPGEASEAACLRRSILENQWHRGFNEVEKALLFTRLHDEFRGLLPSVEDLLVGDLRMPREERSLEPYRFVLSLPAAVLDGLAEGRISLGQAQLLRLFPADRHEGFYRLMTACALTFQESRQAAEWILDLRNRAGSEAGEKQGAVERLCEDLAREGIPPRQRAQSLVTLLRQLKFPLLESWREHFEEACLQAGLRQPGVRVSPDPSFETTEVRVELRVRSETELAAAIEHLSRASRQGKTRALFEALATD